MLSLFSWASEAGIFPTLTSYNLGQEKQETLEMETGQGSWEEPMTQGLGSSDTPKGSKSFSKQRDAALPHGLCRIPTGLADRTELSSQSCSFLAS